MKQQFNARSQARQWVICGVLWRPGLHGSTEGGRAPDLPGALPSFAVVMLVAWMVHTCSNVQSLSGGVAADQLTAVELVFTCMLALRPVQKGDQESDEQRDGEK